MGEVIFLLGGARSGKSRFAETWAAEHGRAVLVIATAQAFDEEMRARITAHRAARPAHWRTLEAPFDVASALPPLDGAGAPDTVVLDCVTLLASNVLLRQPEECSQAEADAAILTEIDGVLHACDTSRATWLIVSNEVGMGIVPPFRLGRVYRDALGRANQRIAGRADTVLLLVAGIPWRLKG